MAIEAAAPLLSVRELEVSFRTARGLVRAVDGLSFDLAAGEILGVVGESGSGKSMSLLSVMGLVNDPNAVVRGSIRYQGRELVGVPPREMRALRGGAIAMIFQDPMTSLTPVYSIGWQIVEQLRAHQSISRTAARRRAIELLGEVGIPNPAIQFERFPHQLSGGTRQRAVIAMALSCNPAILFADEPTTALDVTVQAQILELIRRLRRDFGSAVVLVTHDMGVVAELADRVMVMYAGRVVERGLTAELFTGASHPYTWGLLASIPPLTGPRPHRLPAIAGLPPSQLEAIAGCAFAPRCACRFEACSNRPELDGQATHQYACFIPAGERAQARRQLIAASEKVS